MKKYLFIGILLVQVTFLKGQSSNWLSSLYGVSCGLDRANNQDDYLVLNKDGTIELSVDACPFGGGTRSGVFVLKGTYKKVSKLDLLVSFPEEVSFECVSGFAMKIAKKITVTYNDMNNRSMVITKGLMVYGIPYNGPSNMRVWKEGKYGYYFR